MAGFDAPIGGGFWAPTDSLYQPERVSVRLLAWMVPDGGGLAGWGRDRTARAVPLLLGAQRCGAVFVLASGRVCLGGGDGVGSVEYGRWPNGFSFARFPGALPLAMLKEAFGQKGI